MAMNAATRFSVEQNFRFGSVATFVSQHSYAVILDDLTFPKTDGNDVDACAALGYCRRSGVIDLFNSGDCVF
jgi:hypothetical protein